MDLKERLAELMHQAGALELLRGRSYFEPPYTVVALQKIYDDAIHGEEDHFAVMMSVDAGHLSLGGLLDLYDSRKGWLVRGPWEVDFPNWLEAQMHFFQRVTNQRADAKARKDLENRERERLLLAQAVHQIEEIMQALKRKEAES